MPLADRGQLFPGKKFISTVLDALDTKTAMSGEMTRRYLQRAAMAGVIIGGFYLINYTVIAAFVDVAPALKGIGRLVGALAFGWALFVQGWLTLGYAALLFAFFDIKSRKEEAWLLARFPDYARYRQRVRKLVPFLY